jgi:hypothetical protein
MLLLEQITSVNSVRGIDDLVRDIQDECMRDTTMDAADCVILAEWIQDLIEIGAPLPEGAYNTSGSSSLCTFRLHRLSYSLPPHLLDMLVPSIPEERVLLQFEDPILDAFSLPNLDLERAGDLLFIQDEYEHAYFVDQYLSKSPLICRLQIVHLVVKYMFLALDVQNYILADWKNQNANQERIFDTWMSHLLDPTVAERMGKKFKACTDPAELVP